MQEFNRANDPNGTFASFFAKAKEQTINANRDYASGAISQASALAGVMAVDAKLSANLEVNIMRTGSTIDSAQLTLRPEQVDSLVLAASTIKENQLVLQNILAVAGITNVEPTKAADSLDTLVVDVANEDGATYKIPRGKTAEVSIDSAWYTCKFTRIEKYEKSWCDGDGYTIAPKKSVSGAAFSQRFLNPNESMGAVLVFDQNNPKGYRLAMARPSSCQVAP